MDSSKICVVVPAIGFISLCPPTAGASGRHFMAIAFTWDLAARATTGRSWREIRWRCHDGHQARPRMYWENDENFQIWGVKHASMFIFTDQAFSGVAPIAVDNEGHEINHHCPSPVPMTF